MAGKVRARKAPQLNFQVTEEVIAESIPKDSGHCMIADALKRAMPDAQYISVDLATIRFTDMNAGRRYIYLTPRVAQEALLAFDQGEPPEPFRVTARAAQMVATGTARKARKDLPSRAEFGSQNSGEIPAKIGGKAPPAGPLATGYPGNNTRGRRREYGLRAFIR